MSPATSTTIPGTTATSTRTTTRAHRRARHRGGPAALVILTAWILFAFAGAFLWTIIPLFAGVLLLTAAVRPSIGRSSQRVLDFALLACLLALAFQLLPLPPAVRLFLSPRVGVVDQALWVGVTDPLTAPPRPLSLDGGATRVALLLTSAFVLLFWSARAIFLRAGVRTVSRGIAGIGLALAVVGMAQHVTAPTLVYWRFPTIFGTTFSPYRNRNDFAMWLIMAIPATVGYLAARMESRRHDSRRAVDFHAFMDGTAVWLGGAVCLMSAALLMSLSRSGLMGAGAAVACFVWLSRRRIGSGGGIALLAAAGVVLAIALTYVSADSISERLEETLASGLGGRRGIWGDTWRMAQDFWTTGIGAGAYERAMLVYQQARREFRFNHAHNEYLQLAVEGGLLVGVPMVIAIASGSRQMVRRLREDATPIFWIRAGAVSGLVAVAVQSVWDTGLRMPANAVLFAMLAAVALHDSGDAGHSPQPLSAR